MSSLRGSSRPRIEPESSVVPALQVDSLPLNQEEKFLLKILLNKNECCIKLYLGKLREQGNVDD